MCLGATQSVLFKGRENMARVYGQESEKKINLWDKLVGENLSTPMIYVFTSKNCGFCDTAKPYIESLESKYAGFGVELMYIDVDSNTELVADAKVYGWPYFYFVLNGKVVGSDEGWSDDQSTELERKLSLLHTYGTTAGLSVSTASKPSADGVCGDSAHQTAALAEGIQEMFNELEKKFDIMTRSINSNVEGIKSMVDMRLDAYEKMAGARQCSCGKH